MKQIYLFKEKAVREFGGRLVKGRRKAKRPLAFRGSNHLVLKATSSHLLLKNQKLVNATLFKYASRFGLQIHSLAVQADHIHIHFQVGCRELYNRWIRTITARLVLLIPKLKWRLRPFTRISHWGKDFRRVQNYLNKNKGEAEVILTANKMVEKFTIGVIDVFRGRFGPASYRLNLKRKSGDSHINMEPHKIRS